MPFLPYTAESYHRRPAPSAVNATRTSAFRSFMKSHPDQKGKPYPLLNGINDAWGMPYAMGTAADPVWKLTGTVPSAVSVLATRGFHAPEWFGKQLTGTSDSPFVVVDTGYGCTVWAAQAKVVGTHTIQVGAAGLFEHASNGLDKRNPLSNSTVNFRSRGAIPDAMVIRRDLLDAAIADGTGLGHVLHLFLVETRTADGFCHPMVGRESEKFGFGAQGERIRIRTDLNLARRNLSPAGLAIARTLQTHGAYFGDNSGSATAIKLEQVTAARNPWAGVNITRTALAGITWDDFVVVPRGT